MLSKDKVPLTSQQRNRLTELLKEVNAFLGKKYPIYSIFLSLSALVLILFLIYLFGEDNYISIGLKILTVLSLWAIVILNLKYFHNRLPAWHLRKRFTKLSKDNYYEALRVRPISCEKI